MRPPTKRRRTARTCSDETNVSSTSGSLRTSAPRRTSATSCGVTTGELFMWLADDDRLDPTYASACARVLIEQPDHALVCGRAHYYREGELAFAERPVNLASSSPRARLLGYYGSVTLNGSFYGVTRREQLGQRCRSRASTGCSWASLAFLGKVRTLDETCAPPLDRGGLAGQLVPRSQAWAHLSPGEKLAPGGRPAARDDIRRASRYRPPRHYERLVLGSSAWLLVVRASRSEVWLARVLERVGLFGRARAALELRRRRRG